MCKFQSIRYIYTRFLYETIDNRNFCTFVEIFWVKNAPREKIIEAVCTLHCYFFRFYHFKWKNITKCTLLLWAFPIRLFSWMDYVLYLNRRTGVRTIPEYKPSQDKLLTIREEKVINWDQFNFPNYNPTPNRQLKNKTDSIMSYGKWTEQVAQIFRHWMTYL